MVGEVGGGPWDPQGRCFLCKRSLVYKGGPSKGVEFWGLNEGANGQCNAPVNSEEWVARGGCAEGQVVQRNRGLNRHVCKVEECTEWGLRSGRCGSVGEGTVRYIKT